MRRITARAPGPVRLHANLVDAYERKVGDLRDELQDEPTRTEAFEFVPAL
jgi:hypothetical protein